MWRIIKNDVSSRVRLVALASIAVVAVCATVNCVALAANELGLAGSSNVYSGTTQFHLAPRNALVIGVSALKDGNGFLSLKNPTNDAARVSEALRKANFAVTNLNETYGPDAMTRQNIKKAIYDFGTLLRSIGGVGVVYFSGHGFEKNGRIYLLPYDAYVQFDRDIEEELLPIDLLYDAFSFAGNPLNILVVDACRDDPWSGGIPKFGNAGDLSRSLPSSEDVVLVTSTLSGSKALDGSGDVSPYAAAFIRALGESDEGLSDFFGSIGTELHRIRVSDPDMEVPSTHMIDGRDFIFVPSEASFQREERIYNTGVRTGNRDILADLMWKYSGGYFYTAAKQWLATAPLAPVAAEVPAGLVQLVEESNLRTAPSLESDVVATPEAGTALRLLGHLESNANSHWFPVAVPSTGNRAYVRNDRVRILASGPPAKLLNIQYERDGQTDALSADSVRQIEAIFSRNSGQIIRSATIVGYKLRKSGGSLGSEFTLLDRQAVALEAIAAAGYDAASVRIVVKETTDAAQDDSVVININQ